MLLANRELRAGIKCIDNYTDVCMEKQERVVFRRIYSGITGVVQELCTRGNYQVIFRTVLMVQAL